MKEKLKDYNNIKAQIKKLKWKIKCLENKEITAGTAVIDATGIKGTSMGDSMQKLIASDVDKINEYKREIERLEAETDMIDSFIATLKPLEQKIIILRYIKGLVYEEIAVQVVRDISSVYRIEDMALEKMNLLYKE